MQFTPARNHETIRAFPRSDPQGDVVDQLLLEPLLEVAAGDVFALAPGEGGVVDLEGHAHRGFVDGQRGQGLGLFRGADGIGNLQPFDAAQADDVSGLGLFDLTALQAHVAHDREDFSGP